MLREAERIASRHPLPEFYIRFKAPSALARKLFFSDPLVGRVLRIVKPLLKEDLGHGFFHSMRVSIDCATLFHVEIESWSELLEQPERFLRLSLVTGLLHDICRGMDNHADRGADEAGRILRRLPFSKLEAVCICDAIRNHEAFVDPFPCKPSWCQLLSDCLYDADKFRWGPDTFTHTVWFMAESQGLSQQDLIARFPWGMSGVVRIMETFRTTTGRQYGPDILETGLEIGKEIYRYLLQMDREHAHE